MTSRQKLSVAPHYFQYSRLFFVQPRRILVLEHLLGLVSGRVVDLLERLLRGEQTVVVEGDLFDDTGVDGLLDVVVDGGVAVTGVELGHRGELLGMLADVVDQCGPRLLGDEVDVFTRCPIILIAQTGANSCMFD